MLKKLWDKIKGPISTLALIVGLIVSFIQLKDYISSFGSKIEVKYSTDKFVVPPAMDSVYFWPTIEENILKIIESTYQDIKPIESNEFYFQIRGSIRDLASQRLDFSRTKIMFIRQYKLDIENNSSRVVDDVKCNIAGRAYFYYEKNDKLYSGYVENEIIFDKMLPDEQISLYVWCGGVGVPSITYGSDVASMYELKEYYGYASSIASFFSNWINFLLIIPFVFIVLMIVSDIKKVKAKKEKEIESQTEN